MPFRDARLDLALAVLLLKLLRGVEHLLPPGVELLVGGSLGQLGERVALPVDHVVGFARHIPIVDPEQVAGLVGEGGGGLVHPPVAAVLTVRSERLARDHARVGGRGPIDQLDLVIAGRSARLRIGPRADADVEVDRDLGPVGGLKRADPVLDRVLDLLRLRERPGIPVLLLSEELDPDRDLHRPARESGAREIHGHRIAEEVALRGELYEPRLRRVLERDDLRELRGGRNRVLCPSDRRHRSQDEDRDRQADEPHAASLTATAGPPKRRLARSRSRGSRA